MEEEEDEIEDERHLDIEQAKGKLRIWIKEPRTVRWIRRKFRKFILGFKDESGRPTYAEKLKEMCDNNTQSLEINYIDLSKAETVLAYWIADEPSIIIPYLNQVAFEIAEQWYPGYKNIHNEIYVKIKALPIEDTLRDLRKMNLNTMIKIRGVVTRRSQVFSQLKRMHFICNRCGEKKGPIYQNDNNSVYLGNCVVCQSKGPFRIDSQMTIYRNYQKLTVQETPGTVPPGRVPRHKEVILLGDNIDAARPGDEVEITGIFTNRFEYALNIKHGFPVFSTHIVTNYIKSVKELVNEELTPEDKK